MLGVVWKNSLDISVVSSSVFAVSRECSKIAYHSTRPVSLSDSRILFLIWIKLHDKYYSVSWIHHFVLSVSGLELAWPMPGVFSMTNHSYLFLTIFSPVSLHCKLVPVQYREYDINLFLMIFPRVSLHCKLVPVQFWEYEYGILSYPTLQRHNCAQFQYSFVYLQISPCCLV